jgi:competence ComEA-like helix-hairpin-helix protein
VAIFPKLLDLQKAQSIARIDTSWISELKKSEIKNSDSDEKSFNEYSKRTGRSDEADHRVSGSTKAIELFYFDPNTVDAAGWGKLGIKDKTIHTIQNYLNKGGRFFKAADLKRIYGLHPDEYARLEPFVKIERSNSIADNTIDNTKKEKEPRQPSDNSVDINSGDTSAFISLPGIGAKLATRIVGFRDKLGGFYSINQIGEVYGLQDSVFQKIKKYLKLENSSVKKININTATLDELKAHPYIRYTLDNPIVSYRKDHGPFSKIEDIKKVLVVTDEVYDKVAPYMTVQ